MVFHEIDFGAMPHSHPHAPLWTQSWRYLAEAFSRSGTPPDFGMRLVRTFLDAGLPCPQLQAIVPMGGGAGSYMYGWISETLRSVIPRLEQHGIVTAKELDVDTLAKRLEAEAIAMGSQLAGPLQVGAWVNVP
jgi:hypothetical protein